MGRSCFRLSVCNKGGRAEMKKQEFIDRLRLELSGLPKVEVEERLSFYMEMIDDKIEDGLTEEVAVSEIGDVNNVAKQILSEIPFSKIVKERIKQNRKLTGLEITLLIVGFPIWFTLLASLFAVVISVYASVWVLHVSLWAIEISFIIGSLAGIFGGLIWTFAISMPTGIAFISAGLVLSGLSIFSILLCKSFAKGLLKLTKGIAVFIKRLFIKKEAK